MNRIIESFLETHIKEYNIESFDRPSAFEHFINRCIVNKFTSDRFDPFDIMTDKGEVGIDGVAICVNDKIVFSIDDFLELAKGPITVRFVFIQTKTSECFDGGEIGTFISGVRSFFAPPQFKIKTNEKMERLIEIKDEIYKHSIDFTVAPVLDLFYVTCGNWNKDNSLSQRIDLDLKPLRDSQDFSAVNFYPYDSEKIITSYRELKKKISRSFLMEKRVNFPSVKGVKQAFLGLVACDEFIKILSDDDGNMLTNIFEDNVRDFQGYNAVNTEISNTIKSKREQSYFGLFNNGITLVAKSISLVGDNIEIYDYQIVNGCQTSYVLFGNKQHILKNSQIVIKLIQIEDESVRDRIIYTTNRQTEVKSEAFEATTIFHKRLQDYYNSIEEPYKLFYERRSKQYDLDDGICKNRIVTFSMQIQSYLAMFLNEPHSVHRYYGELLNSYKNKMFLNSDDYDAYFCSSYFNFYVESNLRSGTIEKKYKPFKFYLICAMRALASGASVVFGQSRQQKRICEKLWGFIKDSAKMKGLLDRAVLCLSTALKESSIPSHVQYHSKEVTNAMLEVVSRTNNALTSNSFLKAGDIVHCTVVSVESLFVSVAIKTDDSRNKGYIYKDKFASDIKKLEDEVRVGEIFQAKIINPEYHDKSLGWELSKIFNN